MFQLTRQGLRSLRSHSAIGRTMSTKHTFLVYAPDCTDSEAFTRRMSVRETHLKGAQAAEQAGVMKVGGALLTPESITGGERKLVGSVLVFEAETLEDVRKMILEDIYYTSGVWDSEKLVIAPFVQAAGMVKLA